MAVDLRTFATQIMIAHCRSENHAIGLAESLRAKREEDEHPVVTGAGEEQRGERKQRELISKRELINLARVRPLRHRVGCN